MKVHRTIREGLRYRGWTHSEAIAYFIYAAANRLHIAPNFFHTIYLKESLWRENKQKTVSLEKVAELFRQKWLKQNNGESYFDFGICKLPDISDKRKDASTAAYFDDTLMFPCFFNDNYDKFIVEYMDRNMHEGPYGYTDGAFDVTVKKGDVVIDAGAWIGDISAYAVSKDATTAYAFEPVSETYALLCKTQVLNNINGGGDFSCSERLGRCRV
jgi:hypothetical protein